MNYYYSNPVRCFICLTGFIPFIPLNIHILQNKFMMCVLQVHVHMCACWCLYVCACVCVHSVVLDFSNPDGGAVYTP